MQSILLLETELIEQRIRIYPGENQSTGNPGTDERSPHQGNDDLSKWDAKHNCNPMVGPKDLIYRQLASEFGAR